MKSYAFLGLLAWAVPTLMGSGLVFDAGEVAVPCTVGTPMAPKLMAAFGACSNITNIEEEEEEKKCPPGRRGRKCRQQKKKCPTAKKIMREISKKMAGDLCVLSELGWMDSDGNANAEIMASDVATLPQEVQSEISQEAIQTCAQDRVKEMSSRPEHARCADKMSEDDKGTLAKFGLKISSYHCFKESFDNACSQLVRENIYEYFTLLATSANIESTTVPESTTLPDTSSPGPIVIDDSFSTETTVLPDNSSPEPIIINDTSSPEPIMIDDTSSPEPEYDYYNPEGIVEGRK